LFECGGVSVSSVAGFDVEAFALGAEDAQELHGVCVGVAEPVGEVGVEFGDLAGGEDEVLVTEYYPQPSIEDVEPVVALV
jgi:hypothetical protein